MAETTYRAQIKTLIEGVSDVGLVYDYHRLAVNWDDVLLLFKTTIDSTNVIRGWMITCVGLTTDEWVKTGTFNTGNLNTWHYQIRGFFGVDDSAITEKTAFAKAVEVKEALTTSSFQNLGAQSNTPASLDFNARLFGSILCHHAEVRLSITETT